MRLLLLTVTLAIAGCSTIPKGNPQRDGLSSLQRADIQLTLAQTCEQNGDIPGAISAYEQAVKNQPKNASPWHRLGLLYDRQGNGNQAVECYRHSLDIDDRQANVWNDLGYSLYLQAQWSDAEKALQRSLSLQSEDARVRVNYGMLLARTQRIDAAMDQFYRAGITEAEARCNLAMAFLEEGQPSAAQQQLALARQVDVDQRALSSLQALEPLCARAADHERRLASLPQTSYR